MWISLHDPRLAWFELSATTKEECLGSQVNVYCVPLKVKANCD